MKYEFDIAIIGAGSGGLVVASGAAGLGAKVLLIEGRKMGGDCLNYGCVPSKTFLKSAHLARQMRKSGDYGIDDAGFKVSLSKVMGRVEQVISEIAPHDSVDRFESLGVTVKIGFGRLLSEHEISVNDEIFTTKKIVIATGSTAAVPNINGLNKVKYYTNESIFDLKKLPNDLIILGSGVIGLELGQGFANLGSKVHMISRSGNLFTKDEPEVGDIMKKAITEDGVILYEGYRTTGVEQHGDGVKLSLKSDDATRDIYADALLVATGRKPNTQDIGLDEAGVFTDSKGFIYVDEYMRTNKKNIYACGDACGGYMFTHAAGYEAGMIVRNALIFPMFKKSYHNICWSTFTMPEVSHVGLTEAQAKEKGCFGYVYSKNIAENDRSKAQDDRIGFVKIILDTKKRVIGATIVGECSAEMLPVLSLLISKKMKLSSLLSIIYQYPIQGEILKSVALADYVSGAKEWQRNLLKMIVTRQIRWGLTDI